VVTAFSIVTRRPVLPLINEKAKETTWLSETKTACPTKM